MVVVVAAATVAAMAILVLRTDHLLGGKATTPLRHDRITHLLLFLLDSIFIMACTTARALHSVLSQRRELPRCSTTTISFLHFSIWHNTPIDSVDFTDRFSDTPKMRQASYDKKTKKPNITGDSAGVFLLDGRRK